MSRPAQLFHLHVLLRRIQRVAGGVEFLGWLEHCRRAECRPGIVLGEQGLKFADDLLGGGFRNQITFDLELEALLEPLGHGAAHSPEKL